MSKFAEIGYLVYDKLGLGSDDERFTIDHILYLCGVWRAALIKQYYRDAKRELSSSNYQTICVNLAYNGDCLSGSEMKSVEKIPNFIGIGTDNINIVPMGDRFNNNRWTMVSEDRFNFVGDNKWLRKIIYFTRATDGKLYVKSASPDFKYLQKVKIEGIFEDPAEAAKLACDKDCNPCGDVMEQHFPLEDILVPNLIDIVYSRLANDLYRPEDKKNDADSLSL
ncbi:MAG: hypothetical protein LBE56_12690 [Tannerella sp.]|jgi:hypothetical protein|nr:hypothetical protein [Tannerella sp.]